MLTLFRKKNTSTFKKKMNSLPDMCNKYDNDSMRTSVTIGASQALHPCSLSSAHLQEFWVSKVKLVPQSQAVPNSEQDSSYYEVFQSML